MLLKDSSDLPLYSLIVDVPGKLKGVGFRRIYNKKHTRELDTAFLDEELENVVLPIDSEDPNFERYCNDDTRS